MEIQTLKQINDHHTDIIIPFSKDKIDVNLVKNLSGINRNPDFSGEGKELTILYHPEKNIKVILLGLGDPKESAKTQTYFRSCIHQNRKKFGVSVAVYLTNLEDDQIFNAVNGIVIGMKQNGIFKQKKDFILKTDHLDFITRDAGQEKIVDEAIKTAETQLEIMHLVDLPPNIKTPEFIGNTIVTSGQKYGYNVQVLDKPALEDQGLKALLAVGQGSANPPVLIVAEYKPKTINPNTPKVGLVGKGISFDTGGLSIKPSANMGYMKSDMGGAAAVFGTIELAAKLNLDVHIICIIPAAENSVDANSYRPGDIIGSYSGKSIEVIDTDAEGRLILVDGLSYLLKNYTVDYLVDVATLTGSVIQTLGYNAAGLFTQNDEMSSQLSKAGEKTYERVWRLPLWEDYLTDMLSDMADIKNLSGKPVAGATTAAKFLEFFTENHERWTHLDIAGVAFSDSEYTKMRSATGYGVRLLIEYIKGLVK
ncbi:MAG: leucyl aminopeptidase family protein [Saprospiraceae bacterium]|nr:leucyl aminopeptidase family protein [Saprospiraceae bacterium]